MDTMNRICKHIIARGLLQKQRITSQEYYLEVMVKKPMVKDHMVKKPMVKKPMAKPPMVKEAMVHRNAAGAYKV